MIYLFHSLIFCMHILFILKSTTCRYHIVRLHFLIHYDDLCLFMGVFGLFIFSVTSYAIVGAAIQASHMDLTKTAAWSGEGNYVTLSGMKVPTPYSVFSDKMLVGGGGVIASWEWKSILSTWPLLAFFCGIRLEKSGFFLSFYLAGGPFPGLLARE